MLFGLGTISEGENRKVGLGFSLDRVPSIDLRFHFTPKYCFNPILRLVEGPYYVDDLGVSLGHQFCLPKLPLLKHFLYFETGAFLPPDESFVFAANAGYGLEYFFNPAISVGGRLGTGISYHYRSRDPRWNVHSSRLSVVFYPRARKDGGDYGSFQTQDILLIPREKFGTEMPGTV